MDSGLAPPSGGAPRNDGRSFYVNETALAWEDRPMKIIDMSHVMNVHTPGWVGYAGNKMYYAQNLQTQMIVAQRIDTALHVGIHFDRAMHATDNRKGDKFSQAVDPAIARREAELSWDTWVTPNTMGQPLGWSSDKDWGETVAVLRQYGGVTEPLDAKQLYTNDFVPTGAEFVPPQPAANKT